MSGPPLLEAWLPRGLEALGSTPVALGAGLALLAFGRRLYWLLVAVAGFGLGYYLATRFLELETGPVPLVVGVLAGLICAVAVVLFQKLAVAAIGFLAAGLAMLYVAGVLDWEAGLWVLIAALAAGIVGALVAQSLFELALVVFTSIAGGTLVVMALGVAPHLESLVLVGLIALGVVIQLGLGRKGKGKGKGKD